MRKRIVEIIEEFNENNGEIGLKSLAKKLEVSERTLRYDIGTINEKLSLRGLPEIVKSGKGRMSGDLEILNSYIDDDHELHSELVKEYKKVLILIKVAFEGEINITSLCDDFDLGRTTIKATIKEIKPALDLYGLELRVEPQRGLKLEGSERGMRRLQLKLLNQYNPLTSKGDFERRYIARRLRQYIEEIEVGVVRKFIDFTLSNLNRIISDEAYNIITNYVFIMILRVRAGRELTTSQNENFFYETDEYKAVEKSSALLEAEYRVDLNNYELLNLTDYLMGSHLYSTDSAFMNNWIEIEILTKNFIREFSALNGCDLTRDIGLLEGLINHMKPTMYRVKNLMELENSIKDEFREHYPKIFTDTQKASGILEDFIGHSIPEDEIAFIGMYFKSAIDRNIAGRNRSKNILIVCGMGYGTSKFISQQIRERYQVNIMDIIPENQIERYAKDSDIDAIVSTSMKVGSYGEIPVIKVEPILGAGDYANLESHGFSRYSNRIPLSILVEGIEKNTEVRDPEGLLTTLREICGKVILDDMKKKDVRMADLLTGETIQLHQGGCTWEEGLTIAGRILEERGIAGASYTEKMIGAILENGSYVVTDEGLALPHAKNTGDVYSTGMSLVVFKEPVVFPQEKEVRAILAFTSLDEKEHLGALGEFVDLVRKYDFMDFLGRVTNKRKVLDRIKKYNFLSKLGSN